MRLSREVAHHGGHGRNSNTRVAVQMTSVGRRGSRGETNGVAMPASHGYVGELPPTPAGRGLNCSAAGKRPNLGLAGLNLRRDGVRQLGGLMARPRTR